MILLNILLWVYIFGIGCAFGSFLNVLVYRTHEEIPWWKGRSFCPNCKDELTWKELVPLFSFLFQKGRCKNCREKISFQYPVVELSMGLLLLGVILLYGFTLQSLILGIISFLLLGNFISDLKYMELPDIFSIPSIILACIYQFFYWDNGLWSIVYGVLVGGLFFAIQYILTKGRGLGSGDIRLGVLMGVLLGWPVLIGGLMVAYVGGSIVAVTLLLTKRMNMKSALPLGVFLIPALIFVFIFKEQTAAVLEMMFFLGSF